VLCSKVWLGIQIYTKDAWANMSMIFKKSWSGANPAWLGVMALQIPSLGNMFTFPKTHFLICEIGNTYVLLKDRPSVVVHTYNPIYSEAKSKRITVWSQSELSVRPYLKNKLKKAKGVTSGMAQVVEPLPSKCKALSLIPSTEKKIPVITQTLWCF
jgi:hypothetical protein